MAMRCPYLGLEGDRSHTLPEPASPHRCYKPGRPERVGISYQAQVCLGPSHFRCPRLELLQGTEGRNPGTAPLFRNCQSQSHDSQKPATQAATPPVAAQGTDWRVGSRSRPIPAHPDLSRPIPAYRAETIGPGRVALAVSGVGAAKAAARDGDRRPVTLTELVVIGLGISLVFACLFVGLAVVYRWQVGPGMSAAPEVAAGPGKGLPTLVPTFTPIITDIPTAPVTPTLDLSSAGQVATPAASATAAPAARPPATSPPTRLVIPKIKLDIPVLPVGTKTTRVGGQTRTVWADVPNAGGFHDTSAYPGNAGNTVINGHRDILGAVFRHLDGVQVGDEITLYVGDVAYPYRVVEVLVVPEVFASATQRAENVRLIGHTPEERLTLVTCTPVALATHRLLVIASPAAP